MTNLDGTAITEVERLTLEANQILDSNVTPGSNHLYRHANGDLKVFQVPLRAQSSIVKDLPSLKAFAHPDNEDVQGIWVDDSRITLVSEAESVNDRWTTVLQLPVHPAFQLLQKWRSLTPIAQKDLVRLLRTELRDYVAPTVIQTFASLKFSQSSEVNSQVRPTSTALSSNVRQQVAQENGTDAPETILLRVPVYDIPGARNDEYEVTVYVEYDHDAGKFLLLTVHGDLRAAQEEAVERLLLELKIHADDRFTVVYGSPS